MDWSALTTQPLDGPLSTVFEACPEGEYTMKIDDGDPTKWFRSVKTDRGEVPLLEVPCVIMDDGIKAALGRDKVTARMSIWLDVNDSGQIDAGKGKNVGLGQLRAALGQNDEAGWTFARLPGAGPFLGRVTQRSNPQRPEQKFADVSRVTRL